MTRKKVVAIISIILFLITITAVGCGKKKAAKKPYSSGQNKQQQQQQKTVIGVSLADTKDETGKLIKQGMEQSAKNEKSVQLKFSDAGKDSTKQEEEIDKMLQQKPKVIVLQVVDPDKGKDLVRRIMQKKIKVIAVDKLPKDAVIDGYIAPDYERAGEIAGNYTAKQMIGKPAGVMLLQGETADTQTQNVTTGISKSLGGMTMQTVPIPRGDPQMANTQVSQRLTAGALGAIIATNSQLAVAAADSVKMQNKSGQLTVVGIGGGQKAAQSIQSGDLTAVVDTQPMMVGQTAFKAAMDLAKTQRWEYERNIRSDSSDIPAKLIPVRMVTKDNVFLLETTGGGGGGQSSGGQSGGSQSGGSSGSSGGDKSGGGSKGGSQGSSGSSSSGGSQGGQQGGQQSGQQGMTTIIITTEDGRTMQFTIKGKPKKIESHEGGMPGGQGGGQQGGQSGGGSGGSGGGGGQ